MSYCIVNVFFTEHGTLFCLFLYFVKIILYTEVEQNTPLNFVLVNFVIFETTIVTEQVFLLLI